MPSHDLVPTVISKSLCRNTTATISELQKAISAQISSCLVRLDEPPQ